MTILLWTVGVIAWTALGAALMTMLIRFLNRLGDSLVEDPVLIAAAGFMWPLCIGTALLVGALWVVGRGVASVLLGDVNEEPE